MANRLRIVLDTNVLLAAYPLSSPYREILDALERREYDLVVSTEILLEYQELLQRWFDSITANEFTRALADRENVILTDIWFKWQLIPQDWDDNKFVDCAITGQAHCIVTNDRHFNQLKNIDFPKLNVLKADDFIALLRKG